MENERLALRIVRILVAHGPMTGADIALILGIAFDEIEPALRLAFSRSWVVGDVAAASPPPSWFVRAPDARSILLSLVGGGGPETLWRPKSAAPGVACQIAPETHELGELAKETWRKLLLADSFGMTYWETSLTDDLLLQIFQRLSACTRLIEVKQTEECKTGCDWLWFIGNSTDGWILYASQAKRLKGVTRDSSYFLEHPVEKAGKMQHSVLEDFAQQVRAVPIYVLYNGVSDPASADWHCHQDADFPQLGCSVVPLSTIKARLTVPPGKSRRPNGFQKFSTLHKASAYPWRCLLCPVFLEPGSYPMAPSDYAGSYRRDLPSALIDREQKSISIDELSEAVQCDQTEYSARHILITESEPTTGS